jgi:hypothetical protein
MANLSGTQTSAILTTRADGTVHFKDSVTTGERICQWGLVSLWVITPLLAIALLW